MLDNESAWGPMAEVGTWRSVVSSTRGGRGNIWATDRHTGMVLSYIDSVCYHAELDNTD